MKSDPIWHGRRGNYGQTDRQTDKKIARTSALFAFSFRSAKAFALEEPSARRAKRGRNKMCFVSTSRVYDESTAQKKKKEGGAES